MLAFLLSFFAGLGSIAAFGGSSKNEVLTASEPTTRRAAVQKESFESVRGDIGHDSSDLTEYDGGSDIGHDNGDQAEYDGGSDIGHDNGDQAEHDGGSDIGHDSSDQTEHDNGGSEPIPLPETTAEIAAYVAAVRAAPEAHAHGSELSKMGEHMAVLNLVPRDEATHIAIANGDWDDPSNWHNGQVPGSDAKVLIPDGVHMIYDNFSNARLFTLRVDGHLEFADDLDTKMVIDTMVVAPSGELTIGTEANPIPDDITAEIIFANNGAIDTDWDEMLLSRGMIAHGTVNIHGAVKDSHEKVITDPMAGDTSVDFGTLPEGWEVGDTIIIAGTHYDGYYNWNPSVGYSPSEDEERVVTHIENGRVYFDDPLTYDHDAPRADLKTSVANYTRNISFETENAATAEVYERAHVMFMHNDDVDVRYAEFHELGRTDKSEDAFNAGEFSSIEFDSNVKGRYSFHFHRAGVEDQDDPAIAVGNAVYGSPGWGYVHHDSNALLENNASFNTFGAGYVAESGNETGAWTDNIAILAQGISWKPPKFNFDAKTFQSGRGGDGFWFQGRMVESSDNIAASVNTGFVYFHRGDFSETENIKVDADTFAIPEAMHYNEQLFPGRVPILGFDGNEAFASREGLHVVKALPFQGHDVHSVFQDFTAWNVSGGASFTYTSHYTIENFDLVGREASDLSNDGSYGIRFGTNAFDMTVVDATITNFDNGLNFEKKSTIKEFSKDLHDFKVVDAVFIDVDQNYKNYDPAFDSVLSSDELPYLAPDIDFDGPLSFREGAGGRHVSISGTKSDSLGTVELKTDFDDFSINWTDTRSILDNEGYYSTSDGDNYFLLDFHFSDRLTGDIYLERHPVFLDENVPVGQDGVGFYQNVDFNGVQDLSGPDDPTIDSAILWATLTDGQPVLSEQAIQLEEEELLLGDTI